MGEPKAALVRELRDDKHREIRMARIEQLEDEIYERASAVVLAALSFSEVTPDQPDPPPEWVAEYGLEGARQRLRIAQGSWMPASLAPAGTKLAAQVTTGISRGRAWRVKVTQNNVNVRLTLPSPTTEAHPGPVTYEVRDLEQ